MAQLTIDAIDTLDAGRQKINSNFTETYSDSATAAAAAAAAQSNIDTHEALTNNPHSVTKSQVGLGNADDTSDDDKPVSTATQAAIDTVTKVLVTGTIVLDDTNFGKIHICSGTSVDYTITLPTAVGNEGKMILFKGDADIAILSKLVTIDGSGTEKINNSLTFAITTGGYITIVARVTAGVGSWDIINFDQGYYYAYAITWAGFTVDPVGTFLFKRGLGCVDLALYPTTAGTGTGTTVTFTLPLGLTAKTNQRYLLPYFVNNAIGATVPGIIIVAANANIVSAYTTVAAGAWTGSNGRSVAGSWRINTNE